MPVITIHSGCSVERFSLLMSLSFYIQPCLSVLVLEGTEERLFAGIILKNFWMLKPRNFTMSEQLYSAMYFPSADCDIIFYKEGTDLTKTNTLNKEKYDLFFCTQVFNFIYDVKAAIRGAYYLLKPGATLLGSVAGNISPVSRTDMKLWGHYWGFTYLGIELLLADVFGKENVVVKPLGNVVSAVAYTQGLCLEDISDTSILDHDDENYPIVIGFAAHKR